MRQAVHDVTIVRRSGGSRSPEGHATPGESTATVRGHVALMNVNESYQAGTVGVEVDAVAAVPLGTTVQGFPPGEADAVRVAGAGVGLDGPYEIVQVRNAVKVLRLWLRRVSA